MDDKVRLKIIGISYNEAPSEGYVLVLGEQSGSRRIPIVIGAMEAQAIALQIEHISPPRPLTHDLFLQLARAFTIELLEVNITHLDKGVFYSELVCFNGEKQISIDARTSDAIALALRFHCPVFTTEEIMKKASIVIDESQEIKHEAATATTLEVDEPTDGWDAYTIDELKKRLQEAIEREDYETAAKINAEIKLRDQKS